MRKEVAVLTISLLLLLGLPAWGAEPSVLVEMGKQEGLGSTRFSMMFKSLPEFSSEHSGQRLDILLSGTKVSDQLLRLPEDETVVKILLAEKGDDLLVSLLLRRPPKQIVSKSTQSPAQIDFDLYWDSARGSRPAVAFRIEGIPGRKDGRKVRVDREFPSWRENWRQIFQADLTPWTLDPALHFSLPQLPPFEIEASAALQQRLDLAKEGRWHSLLRFQPEMPTVETRETLFEELLVSEALLRTDAIAAAEAHLRGLEEVEGEERIRVDYLTDFALAASGQPYAALLKLQGHLERTEVGTPFGALLTLLAVETALASNNDQTALVLLENEKLRWPQLLGQLAQLRRGDALCGLERYAEALDAYRKVENPDLVEHYPRSRARAARAAFAQAEYALAAGWYKALANQLDDQPEASLAFYAAAAASYNLGDTEWALIGLQKVVLENPGSEGADRAALRLQDHQVLSGGELEKGRSIHRYAELAKVSRLRDLREEASFKRALLLYLLGDSRESIERLMNFRRSFASGALRDQADSLLREQLPTVISDLIDQGEDLPAVVLVEQNRKLLLQEKLEKPFLDRIAGALSRLGLFKRAARILLFQLDRAQTAAEREEFYLPLAQLYLLRQEYRAASDYAKSYLDSYPQGERRGAIYGLMLDALEKQKRQEELLQQLERSDRPQSPALDIRAAWVYAEQSRFGAAIRRLEHAREQNGIFQVKDMALLAEGYYQLQRNREAVAVYRSLLQDETFGPQSFYRSAQLLLRLGDRESGLKLLREFVDKEKSDPWSVLARDLLLELGVTNF